MERWQAAQTYERSFWASISSEISQGSPAGVDFYEWRARQLGERLVELGRPDIARGEGRVLEIGNGPVGLVAYLAGEERVAVDPLEDFYARDARLAERRDPGVRYLAGMGEDLPVEEGRFDLVIIENCIDHVRDMDRVMQEIRRALKPAGLLYLTVNTRTRWGFVAHRVLSRLRIDPGHPHTVTKSKVRSLVRRNDFAIVSFEAASFIDAWKEDLAAGAARPIVKGLLGVSEFLTTVFAKK